jgi:hypothetical protein
LTLTDNCFVWFVTSPANFKALSNSKLVPPTQEIRLGQELLARVVKQEIGQTCQMSQNQTLSYQFLSPRLDLCKASRHFSLGWAVSYGQGRSKIAVINGRKIAFFDDYRLEVLGAKTPGHFST